MATAAQRRREAAIRARNARTRRSTKPDAGTARDMPEWAQDAEADAAAERRQAAKTAREERRRQIREEAERRAVAEERPGKVMRDYLRGEITDAQAVKRLREMSPAARERFREKYTTAEYGRFRDGFRQLELEADAKGPISPAEQRKRDKRADAAARRAQAKARDRGQDMAPSVAGAQAGQPGVGASDRRSVTDLMLQYLDIDHLAALQKIMAPGNEQRFYDETGSSFNKQTGQRYTYEDYARARAANLPWTIDETQLLGPIFYKRGNEQALSETDKTALGIGAVDSRGLPAEAFLPGDRTMTLAEFNDEIFNWFRGNREMAIEYQQMLYDAGYYEFADSDYAPSLSAESTKVALEPMWGELDDATLQASAAFTSEALSTGLALDIDIFEMLDRRAAAKAKQREVAAAAAAAAGGGGSGRGGAVGTQLTDDAAIRQLGDSIGQEVYGRRLTADESQQVAEAIRRAEEEEGAAIEAGGNYESVAPEARIRKLLRDLNPGMAQGTDIAGAFSMFANIMQSGLGLGSGFGTSALPVSGGGGGVFASPTTGG